MGTYVHRPDSGVLMFLQYAVVQILHIVTVRW